LPEARYFGRVGWGVNFAVLRKDKREKRESIANSFSSCKLSTMCIGGGKGRKNSQKKKGEMEPKYASARGSGNGLNFPGRGVVVGGKQPQRPQEDERSQHKKKRTLRKSFKKFEA